MQEDQEAEHSNCYCTLPRSKQQLCWAKYGILLSLILDLSLMLAGVWRDSFHWFLQNFEFILIFIQEMNVNGGKTWDNSSHSF